MMESWADADGYQHRVGGPAIVTSYDNGTRVEEWFVHGLPHRVDGPQLRRTTGDGRVEEWWRVDGGFHRVDGPAIVEVDRYGNRYEEHWVHGERVDDEQTTAEPVQDVPRRS